MHPNRVQTPSHPPTLSLSITNTHSLSSFFIGGEQKKYLEKHLSPAFIGGGQNSSAACDGGQSFRVSVFFFVVDDGESHGSTNDDGTAYKYKKNKRKFDEGK